MGSAIGDQSGMVIAFLIAGGMKFFSCWYSDKLGLKTYKAREVSETEHPAFYGMVRRLALQASVHRQALDQRLNAEVFLHPSADGGADRAAKFPNCKTQLTGWLLRRGSNLPGNCAAVRQSRFER